MIDIQPPFFFWNIDLAGPLNVENWKISVSVYLSAVAGAEASWIASPNQRSARTYDCHHKVLVIVMGDALYELPQFHSNILPCSARGCPGATYAVKAAAFPTLNPHIGGPNGDSVPPASIKSFIMEASEHASRSTFPVIMRSLEEMDPIAAAIAPPQNESSEERHIRIQRERAAKKVSDDIDDQLSRERQQAKRQAKPVKILLLGQSESGKSTTLKNFQLMCEPKAFRAERASWRAIIHLNVIRSFRVILDALARASGAQDVPPSPHSSYSSQMSIRPDTELLALRNRLLPLLQIEDALARRLGAPETRTSLDVRPSPSSSRMMAPRRRAGKEVAVNSTGAWKRAFMRETEERESFDTEHAIDWDDPDDPGALLHARAEDMQRLWAHPTIRTMLDHQGIRLEESPGFFLDVLNVVTAPRYVPTDDHILRARLKTLGVSEHRMRLTEPNGSITREFHIFDVGGTRSMRPKWVPYFMDMDAIIFLAPISAFDQVLLEDPGINRLADSLELWTAITSNKLLEKTNLILFLNKVDIMQAKLASGIRLCDHFSAYGRRPNDFDSASRYLRKQFGAILKHSSPSPRILYCHLTNVIDTKSTTFVLAGIKDMLMRFHLKESHLIL